jgi:hypothetical protein
MKQILMILLSIAFLNLLSTAQQLTLYPTEISSDVHHDVSPPLRDMQLLEPGQGKMRWKDGEIPNNPFPFELMEKNNYLQSGINKDPVIQDQMGKLTPVNTISNFDGINGDGGYVPPDPNGAVGINYYIETVNVSFAIYSKTGTLVYGPANMGTIWQGFQGGFTSDGDPIVLFDHLANRWLISQFSLPNYPNGPFYELIAVSKTEDPLGEWNRYAFRFTQMPDYPKLGIWPDGYYISAHSFSAGALNWVGPIAIVLERDSILAGSPARMFSFQQASSMRALIAASLDGPEPPAGTPGYFLFSKEDSESDTTDQLRLFELHVDWADSASSTFIGPNIVNTAEFDMSMEYVPQKGTNRKLEVLPYYLMYRAQYRNFGNHQTIMVNHSVDAGGNNHAGIRWYELRKSNGDWSIFQQGTYAPDAYHRWMGSVAMDGNGNIAMGYSVSGDTIYPSIGITGRHAGDAPGYLTCIEEMVISGSGSQTGESRWGDYSSLCVDPVDDETFWYTNEYYPVSSSMTWNTRVASFTINDLQVGLNENPSTSKMSTILNPNFPNPFSRSTSLYWTLPEPANVKVQILDLTGKTLSNLIDENQVTGEHKVTFDASNFKAGIYICKISAGRTVETQKLILIK